MSRIIQRQAAVPQIVQERSSALDMGRKEGGGGQNRGKGGRERQEGRGRVTGEIVGADAPVM